ncbi:MAG TPA: class I adenylate-forming enzyme family protein [Actinomycetota bacterium]|nr:class I adenylate-forming enzyme family protein [Actinomycetota bacterium]
MRSEVARLLQEAAQDRGDRPAVIEGRTGATLSWSALGQAAEAWAHRLEAAALPPGTAVGLLAEHPLAFIPAYLGLLAAGAVVLPLDPSAPSAGGQSEAASALAEFQVAVLVTDTETGHGAASVAGIPAWQSAWGAAAAALGDASAGPLPPRSARPAVWVEPASVVLRTSGTTGRPKGVPLHEAQLLHGARAVAGHHGFQPGERVYSSLPLFHINAQVTGLMAAVVSGTTLVVDGRFHRQEFWDVLDSWEVGVLNAVPAILALLADGSPPPEAVTRRIRFARSASAPLPLATLTAFEALTGIGVLETYGMTEAAGQICANPLCAAERRPGTVGRGVGIEVRVADDVGAGAAPEVPGGVQIRGPSVTPAYAIPDPAGGMASRRPAVDREGWLTTGDVGSLDAGGFLTLLGRTDGVINRGGEKLYPREVEEVLRRHAGVAEVAVVGEPDPVLGERPVAFVVPRVPGGSDQRLHDELVALCAGALGRHKRPARIQVTERLPATPTGKVRRDQLKAMVVAAAAGEGTLP